MKRLITSAGLVALGAASVDSVEAAYTPRNKTPGLTPMESAKPWNVTVGVRGFYDDNMFTAPEDSGREEDSWGVSINPTVGLNFPLERTLISFNYSYDFRWFEARDSNEADHIHVADLSISHEFTERFSAEASDRFILAQEGAVVLDGPQAFTGRSDGDYVRNDARVGLHAGLSERISLGIGYRNQIFDYEQDGHDSYSALLDRMEHLPSLEVLITLTPKTEGIIGGRYSDVASRSTDTYTFAPGPLTAVAEARDRRSYQGFLGLQHAFNPQVTAGLRAGVEFTDYYNVDILNQAAGAEVYDDSSTTPFIDASLEWNYNPGSKFTLGVVHRVNSTDVGSALSQNSTAVWGDLHHRLSPKWTLGALALFQYSRFEGGVMDGNREIIILAGVNAMYEFGPHLLAEIGYNFDKLDSELSARDYDRNRFYAGLRARF